MTSDDEDYKARIKNAVAGYLKRQEPKPYYDPRKNATPERDLIRNDILPWCKAHGFSVNVVESKATYNPKSGRYIAQSVKQGFVDIVGNHISGLAVFIEAKAPGKRSTLRANQRTFLLEKIETGCFAICVDSVALLESQFYEFQRLKSIKQFDLAKDFLKTALPPEKVIDDGPLFD